MFSLDNTLNNLIKHRIVVLSILGGILLISLVVGMYVQNKNTKELEANALYDDAWQKIFAVVQDLKQPQHYHIPGDEHDTQVRSYFNEGLDLIDILIQNYPSTVAAARAVLILTSLVDEPVIVPMIDPERASEYGSDDYYRGVINKHNDFWGAIALIGDAGRFEKKGQFAEAIVSYREALKKDHKKYISDFILVSIAKDQEVINDTIGALATYQELIQKYPDSEWTAFAQAKIYLFENSFNPDGSAS